MSDSEAHNISLPAIVDLDALDEVREQLLDAVGHGSVTMDGSKVERIATNALVMRLAGAETARRNDFELSVEGASEAMKSAISRLGFDERYATIVKG